MAVVPEVQSLSTCHWDVGILEFHISGYNHGRRRVVPKLCLCL